MSIGAPVCCCRGMVGTVDYKCLGRALDLGHCRIGDCDRRCQDLPTDRPPVNDYAVVMVRP